VAPVWPTVNAALNAAAAICLTAGLVAIRHRRIPVHRACMLAALACSVAFLVSYLAYHASLAGVVTRFPGTGAARTAYLVLLGSHTLLALPVAILAPVTATLGLRGRIDRHRRLARVTAPSWLYVSVTGVAVYVWLYWLA
jgi:putative membrane protein